MNNEIIIEITENENSELSLLFEKYVNEEDLKNKTTQPLPNTKLK